MDRVTSLEATTATLTTENTALKENIDALVSCTNDLGRRLHNKTRQAIRARASSAKLRGDLIRLKHTRAVQAGRLGHRKADGIRKALLDARAEPNKHLMKGKGGIFTENTREMIRDLVALKVPVMKIDPVIHTVGWGLGREVQDHVSAQQINRVVEEGGIASDLQVTSEIRGSKAFGTSGDGTTIRHINFEAKHVTYTIAGEDMPVTRMLNITSALNHTSAADPIDLNEFITWLTSLGTDHANDQLLLAKLKREWKITAQKIMLGKKYLASTDLQTYLPLIQSLNDAKIEAAGGLDSWNALPEEEKTQQDIDALGLFWESIGGPAPVKLMNKGNPVAAQNSTAGLKASEHALEVSEGGAVKLTSLVGALFNHKDNKKGQQDTFKIYFENFLGYTVSCPDTINTRFQSHCDCAIFIILYLPQILAFMIHIMYSKTEIGLNHLEQNILMGLKDIPTLTELAILALYALSVGFPYMRMAQGLTNGRRVNALDMGPFHAKVIAFCEAVADNPDLLLAPDASYKTGTLDGQVWEHPEAFYAAL
ncbi:hypothetical protein B0H14DRAFT_3430467 [Mycena olivaceomarginata]|nr:hypothetical protein B0H14DRAFT_3430467 [Mycena olivaceomarginata]